MAEEGQSDKTVSDMEMQMNKKFWNWIPPQGKKNGTLDIHQHVLSIYGDQTYMGTVTQWVLGFSYGNSDRMSPPLLQIFYKHPTQVLVHQWPKHIANGSDYVGKQCFVAENLLHQAMFTVLFVPFLDCGVKQFK